LGGRLLRCERDFGAMNPPTPPEPPCHGREPGVTRVDVFNLKTARSRTGGKLRQTGF
jgi:hypothetical protein